MTLLQHVSLELCLGLDELKSGTNLESNHAWVVCKAHYAKYYVRKSSILSARTGVSKQRSIACGFSPFKIHFLITRKVQSAE